MAKKYKNIDEGLFCPQEIDKIHDQTIRKWAVQAQKEFDDLNYPFVLEEENGIITPKLIPIKDKKEFNKLAMAAERRAIIDVFGDDIEEPQE